MTMHPQSVQIFLLLEGLGGLMRFMEHHHRRSLSLRKKVSSEIIHGKTTWNRSCGSVVQLIPFSHRMKYLTNLRYISLFIPSQTPSLSLLNPNSQSQSRPRPSRRYEQWFSCCLLLISTRLNRQLRQLNLSLQPLLDKTPTTFYMTTVGNAHLSQHLLMPSTSLTNLSWTGRSTLQLS